MTTVLNHCGLAAGRLRHSLLATVLVCAASPDALAQSEAAACREIQDTLLRLRCYDDITKPATSAGSVAPKTVAKEPQPHFNEFPADSFRGPIAMPDFRGRDRAFAIYRTRIRDGAKGGPNLAGYLALVQIGCGAGCSTADIVDLRDGRVSEFPLGGDDNQSLDLLFRASSRLVVARWVSQDDRCKTENLVWMGSAFQRGFVRDLGDRDKCYEAMRNE